MVLILLMMKVLFLFFSNYLLGFGFKPIPEYFLHDFARMTDVNDGSVVLAELYITFLRECNNQWLSPCGRPFFCSPNHVTNLR